MNVLDNFGTQLGQLFRLNEFLPAPAGFYQFVLVKAVSLQKLDFTIKNPVLRKSPQTRAEAKSHKICLLILQSFIKW